MPSFPAAMTPPLRTSQPLGPKGLARFGWCRSKAGDSERIRGNSRKLCRGGGQLVAHGQESESERVTDLLDDLLIWRHARACVEMKFDHSCPHVY